MFPDVPSPVLGISLTSTLIGIYVLAAVFRWLALLTGLTAP
jgi:hypothetical protein